MKRYRFIVLFAVFTLLSFTSSLAQNRFYLACNFYALNGTCFNQPPSWYAQTETDGYSPEQIEHFTNQFITDYPNYPVVAPASNLYNCHGFAYSVFQGGEEFILEWKDYLCSYNGASIESYIQIPENAVQPGDIATIIDPDDNGTYSIHSSIVLNQDTLISKLGNYPVFKHHKYDPWIVSITNLGPSRHYVYYRRIINTQLTGPDIIDGSGTYIFTPTPNISLASCTWSVEPADMFQTASGTGTTANLTYKTPFTYLAPKARITFTFSYSCDNHYSVSKEIDLLIPTTTISGTAVSDGFVLDTNAVVAVPGEIL